MDNLLSLFNTLLGIEIAIFGIISAVILVFIQLVYTNYTYKHISHLLQNWWLRFFFGCSILDLILTTAGSYFLTVANFKLLNTIFTNPWYLLVCLSLIFISISFFTILIIKNISYLQPHRAIFILSSSIHYENLRDYLWKKYPPEPPYNLRVRLVFDTDNEKGLKETEEESDRRLEIIEKQIADIKKRTEKSDDPLLPIRDMMIQFIRRADLSSLTEAQELLLSISTNFINKVPKNTGQEWSPNDDLWSNYCKYLLELLSTLLEISEKEGLESAKRIILNISYRYADKCFQVEAFTELDLINKFLEKVADTSIGKSSIIFQDIMEHYQVIGEKTFHLLKEKPSEKPGDARMEVLDNIFRHTGWLGERLLMRHPIEDSPLMANYEYSTESDALLNCLLSFEDCYIHDQPGAYPLIYFDALFVVLRQLVNINKTIKNKRLNEHIYSLVSTPATFAEEAIRVGNSKGAALAVLRVKESYDELKNTGLDNLANDVIRLFIRIGMLAAGYKEILPPVEFIRNSLDQWIADTLVESGADLDRDMLDCYIHTGEVKNHDASWDFITKLGMRLGTNFGMAFNPSTGK